VREPPPGWARTVPKVDEAQLDEIDRLAENFSDSDLDRISHTLGVVGYRPMSHSEATTLLAVLQARSRPNLTSVPQKPATGVLQAPQRKPVKPEPEPESEPTKVTFFTDGSCDPNPGLGGWAVVRDMQPVAMGSEPWTTNIRMEGQAIVAALRLAAATGAECQVYTDSQFWVDVITRWAGSWRKNGWQRKGGAEVKNLDIVKEAYRLFCASKGRTQLVWVRGHDGNRGNEQADRYAEQARCNHHQ
jgi:ribonuclease HI